MFQKVLRFVRLPLVLILLYAVLRLVIGLRGVPYAPRGNAMFSTVGLTLVSCIYFGALSRSVANFSWKETALVGATLGLTNQVLIFVLTLVSYLAGLEASSYYTHWDALNLPEGSTATMAQAVGIRAPALFFGTLFSSIFAMLGRLLGGLAPKPSNSE